jgi:hypothetical protein
VTSRNRTIALVPVAALLLLGACGGGGESSKKTVTEARQKQAGSSPAAPSPTTGPQEVLARNAKRICESLGIDALAAKYNVDATPEAAATAYAASYPPTFRAAVHGGCRSAFSRR